MAYELICWLAIVIVLVNGCVFVLASQLDDARSRIRELEAREEQQTREVKEVS